MIRRTSNRSGDPLWILISQVEHARLSGLLAEHWGQHPYAPLSPHEEMVAAIGHHDDGWAAWEVAPKVDAQRGRPLDFTETPLTDSLAIWRDSIERAADLGPLAAYMVSGHFSALLERFSAPWKADPDLTALANHFLDQQRADREKRLAMWRKLAGETATREAADRAVAWLQMFDWISLWLCCEEHTEAQQFAPPAGPPLTLRPAGGPYDIEVSPWPYRVEFLEFEVVGRSIPAVRYAHPSDVATAAAEPATLKWRFRPFIVGDRVEAG